MSNIKLYYVSEADMAVIKATKLPKQALQLYEALAESKEPMRGVDIVAKAIETKGLITKQDYAVLAAWYFSPKRRPELITYGKPAIVAPQIEDTTNGVEDEIEVA